MICTFYSYKGGVGRSMALANVADAMARRGLKVLMIDFDLEAPGLEQFFQINQRQIRRHLGLLDLLLTYKHYMSGAGPDDGQDGQTGKKQDRPFTRLKEDFILPVYDRLPSGGRLDILPAGQRGDEEQLARYASNLRAFDWQDFYYNWAGETFFEWLRRTLVPAMYDLVLVDSRTGVTEMGGICAYQLADVVVMLCATNQQNMLGTASVLQDLASPRVLARRAQRPLVAVVVPARVEQRDDPVLQDFRRRFEEAFDRYTPPLLAQANVSFWDLLIPYDPHYAFEERVFSDPEREDKRRQMAGAFRSLVNALSFLAEPGTRLSELVSGEGAGAPLPISEVEPQYDVTQKFAGYDVFLAYDEADQAAVEAIAARLQQEAGLCVFLDRWHLLPGRPWVVSMEEALQASRSCAFLVGPSGAGPWQNTLLTDWLTSLQRNRAAFRVIPVLLPGANPDAISGTLMGLQWVDLRAGPDDPIAFGQLVDGVRGVAAKPAAIEYVCPYRGLEPFQVEHAELFFGREAMTRKLLDRLREASFVAVVGPSGCGKSSLVRAGLVPALRRGALSGSQAWRVELFRPGDDPLRALAQVLVPILLPDAPPVNRLAEARKLADSLRAGTLPIEDVLARLRQAPASPSTEGAPARLVLVVDQFEEVYTLCADEAQRRRFVEALLRAADGSWAAVVLTLRADFFGRVLADERLGRRVEAGLVAMLPMSRDELREAVEQPALRAGRRFEEGLVERILDGVEGSPGDLPLLEFALTELWAQQTAGGMLTHAAYESIGEVRGAIAHRADAAYATLAPGEQGLARTILTRLVRVAQPEEGIEDSRQRVAPAELSPEAQALVKSLADARLLVTGRDAASGADFVEVAHEAIIRNWAPLREWLDRDREFLVWRQRLATQARIWEESGRSEGALLRGALLQEAGVRAAERGAELADRERAYIAASEAAAAREEGEREAARRRELAQARLRWRAQLLLGVAVVVALTAALAAGVFSAQKQQARQAQATAQVVAVQQQGTSEAVSTVSVQQQATAEAASTVSVQQQATAKVESTRTTEQAAVILSQQLATQSDGQLADQNDDLALLLAIEAVRSADTVQAVNSTYQALDAVGCQILAFSGAAQDTSAVEWSPDGSRFLIVGSGGQGQIWDADTRQRSTTLSIGRAAASSIVWSPGSTQLLITAADGTARVYSALTGEQKLALGEPTGDVSYAAWSPDSARIVTAGADGAARLWDASTGRQLMALEGHTGAVTYAAFSPDGARILTAGSDGTARVWNASTGALLAALPDHAGGVRFAGWSPDGREIVTDSGEGTLRLWDGQTGKQLWLLVRSKYGIRDAAWSPDGGHFLTVGNDGLIHTWDATTGRALLRLTKQTDGLNYAAWSPDGSHILTASQAGTARVWDAQTGAELMTFFGSQAGVRVTAWSPDGGRILTVSADGAIRQYYTDIQDIANTACRCATRNMTPDEWDRFFGIAGEPYRLTCPNLPKP